MRVLLDECLPRKLKNLLTEHQVATVPEMGWAGKKNGELLKLAAAKFDVFITADQNMTYQQYLENTPIAVVSLVTKTNRFESYQSLIPQLQSLLASGNIRGVIKLATESS